MDRPPRRAPRWSMVVALLGGTTACAARSGTAEADPGGDFDAVSEFLVPGMESYRFGRATVIPDMGLCRMIATITFQNRAPEARTVFAECGQRFRPNGLGQGEYEGIFAQDFGPASNPGEDAVPEGEIVGLVRGIPIHFDPATREGGHEVGPTRASWVAVVEGRYCVIATSWNLMCAALERRGQRKELVAGLRLPVQPGWRSDITILRRFPLVPGADTTNPNHRGGNATLDPSVHVEAYVVEFSGARLGLTVLASSPMLAAQFYRDRWFTTDSGVRDGVKDPAVTVRERENGLGEMEAVYNQEASGIVMLVLDLLFGLNWQL